MTNDDYLAASQALSREADEFMEAAGLLRILRAIGDVEFLGSYALQVMNRRDIDTHVAVEEPSLALVAGMMGTLRERGFTRFWIFDNLAKACSSDPRYILCESAYRFYDDGLPLDQQWTLSVAFSTTEEKHECFKLHRGFASALSNDDSLRPEIVRLKYQLREAGHVIAGKDVYAAVIEKGCRSVSDFLNEAERTRRPT